VNLVDRLVDQAFDSLGLHGLGLSRGLRSALVTPRFATSRHIVALMFEPGAAGPCLVVKLPRRAGDNAGVEAEGRILRRLTEDAGTRVPGVPRFVGMLHQRGHSAVVEEAVLGTALDPAAVRRDPQGAVEAGVAFTASLPVTGTEPGDAWYERSVAAPLRRLAPYRPFGDETAQLLERTHEALAPLRGSAVVTVVEHGDLSHPNIFRGGAGALQVIDWERSDPLGLPGGDLVFYLQHVHESLRAAHAPAAQLDAFDHAFVRPGAPQLGCCAHSWWTAASTPPCCRRSGWPRGCVQRRRCPRGSSPTTSRPRLRVSTTCPTTYGPRSLRTATCSCGGGPRQVRELG
jgi:aminoglycoside phosphotransferase (APT) family kinase protein